MVVTAGTAAGAAAVVATVFAAPGTPAMRSAKQTGTGLPAAVPVDATVVRGVPLPAATALPGERNRSFPARATGAWVRGFAPAPVSETTRIAPGQFLIT